MRKKIDAPLLVMSVGFVFSLAANLLWTWDGGIVRIMGGALASCALPGAIHLWAMVPVTGWITRGLRAGVMSLIALGAAVTTFVHAYSLLTANGEDPYLAAIYPAITELLVAMGVLAHKTPPKAAAATAPRRSREAQPVPTPSPAGPPPAAPVELEKAAAVKLTALEWTRRNWPVANAQEIQEKAKVGKTHSHRIYAKVKAENAARVLEPVS